MPVVMMPDVYPDYLKVVLTGQESIQSDVQFYRLRYSSEPGRRASARQVLILPLRVTFEPPLGRGYGDLLVEVDMDRQRTAFLFEDKITAGAPPLPDWYSDVKGRIETLGRRLDEWKGPGSRAPETDAERFALEMLRKLALEGVLRRPSIGLDFEGTFSFAWFDEDVSADLTVYGDGTYSFFVSSAKYSTSADDEPIKEPLHRVLLSALLS